VRSRSPTSHAHISLRLSPLDVIVAAVAPVLALDMRHALVNDAGFLALAYCLVSFGFSLFAFAAFRIHRGIPRYLSPHDLADLTRAVVAAELLTCVVLFTVTRLEGIPRSVPAIHALILGAGLLGVRAVVRFVDNTRARAKQQAAAAREHVIVVGLNDMSVSFMKFLEVAGAGRRKVVALLDDEARWYGRSVNGVRVYGPPGHLEALINEFGTHGVQIGCIAVGVERTRLSDATQQEIRRVCDNHHLDLVFVPQSYCPDPTSPRPAAEASACLAAESTAPILLPAAVARMPYFRTKRMIEFLVALLLIVALTPLWLLAALIAFLDVGSPVLFWQQRAGLGGRAFQLYKFRTLRPAFDRSGHPVSEESRLSRAGNFLRRTRLDEVPQLLNVLVGEMSLIGPRPLLPQDQPPDPSVRLAVRPGITGWAQVNGGTLLAPEEKGELDAWYVTHASFWVDLRIIAMTVRSLFSGDRRPEPAPVQPEPNRARDRRPRGPIVSARFASTAPPDQVADGEQRHSTAHS